MKLGKNNWLTKIHDHHVAITPYMLTDLEIVKDKCRTFKKLFPNVDLYYAVKAFSRPELLQSIKNEVDGFDAASIDEINEILKLGVAPKRIIYSNPVKPIETIHEAALRGVDKFTFQSREELQKIAKTQKKVGVFVRIRVSDLNSAVPLSTKFGCSADEAVELLQYAQKLGLTPAGFTFHVGSQQTGRGAWEKAIKLSHALIKEARAKDLSVSAINLGGGLPARYSPDDPVLEDVAKEINRALGNNEPIKYMAEPGRYIVAESSAIVASVIGIEERQGKPWVWLDVGLFQAFVGATRFEPFPYPPFYVGQPGTPPKKGSYKNFVLTGPTCDSHDIITYEAELPANLTIGDRIAFPNTGAYTLVYGAPFNGFNVPPVFFVGASSTARR